MAVDVDGSLGAIAQVELAEDMGDVILHRFLSDVEGLGNLAVVGSRRD